MLTIICSLLWIHTKQEVISPYSFIMPTEVWLTPAQSIWGNRNNALTVLNLTSLLTQRKTKIQPDPFEDSRHWCGGNKTGFSLLTVRAFPECIWKLWPPYFSPLSLTLLTLQYYSFLHVASMTLRWPRSPRSSYSMKSMEYFVFL